MMDVNTMRNIVVELGDGWYITGGSLVTTDGKGRYWIEATRRDRPGAERIELVDDGTGRLVMKVPTP